MPRLQLVGQRAGIAGPATPQASEVAFGGGTARGGRTARGLAAVGQGLGVVEQKINEVKDHVDKTFVAKSLALLRERATKRMIDGKMNAPLGGEGFTDGQVKSVDEDMTQLRDQAPSRGAADLLDLRAANIRASVLGESAAFEATQRIKKRVADANDALRSSANAVLSNPGQYKETLAELEDSIRGMNLPPAVERAQLLAARQTSTGAHLAGLMKTNPSAVKAKLKSGEFDKILDPSVKARLDRQADAEIKANAAKAAAKARAEMTTRLRDELAHIKVHGERSGRVDDATVKKIYGAEKGGQVVKLLNDALELATTTKSIIGMSPAEERDLLEKGKPHGEGAADELKRYNILQKAITEKREALAKDPAGYVARHFPDVATKMADALSDPNKARAFADDMLDQQKRLGVPRERRTILPRSTAIRLAERINGEADPTKRADLLAGLANTFGTHWPAVHSQLQKEGKLPDGTAVMGQLVTATDGPTRRDLATALKIGAGELNKSLGEVKASEVDSNVGAQLQPLFETLKAQGGGTEQWIKQRNAISTLARLYVVRDGMSANEAASKAYNAVIGDKYHFKGSYRVPRVLEDGTRTDTGRIVYNLSVIKGSLEGMKLNAPPARDKRLSDEQRNALYFRNVMDKGQWVTSSDETGVVLIDEFGRMVTTADGKKVFVPFKAANSNDEAEVFFGERFGVGILSPRTGRRMTSTSGFAFAPRKRNAVRKREGK